MQIVICVELGDLVGGKSDEVNGDEVNAELIDVWRWNVLEGILLSITHRQLEVWVHTVSLYVPY